MAIKRSRRERFTSRRGFWVLIAETPMNSVFQQSKPKFSPNSSTKELLQDSGIFIKWIESLTTSLDNQPPITAMNLEVCIRTVLESGELWPGMEAQIHHLVNASDLSTQERTMLQILQDAIQDGCVRRIQLSRSSAALLLN